ncbi:MAG: iron ABC transporter permease [Saprospiraceae bacterium]|nr:iron ABC transporter permease [Saprospiraceae bacterium]
MRKEWIILIIILIFSSIISLGIGTYSVRVVDVLHVFAHKLGISSEAPESNIVYLIWNIRFPRILMGIFVGCALAISGAAVQGLFRNPLADPSLIGVTGGAMLAAVIFIVIGGSLLAGAPVMVQYFALGIFAFLGGLASTFLVYRLASLNQGAQTSTLLLAGVAITSITGAVAGFFIYFSTEEQLRDITFWTMGSLSGSNWMSVLVVAFPVLFSSVILYKQARGLDALLLGEEEAEFLGIEVRKLRSRVIIHGAVLVGVCIAMVGMIGFLGLVIPHLVRLYKGAKHHFLIIASGFLGAIVLVLADLLARIVVQPAELPIGILTALIGGPFFFYLLLKSKHQYL